MTSFQKKQQNKQQRVQMPNNDDKQNIKVGEWIDTKG